eukprot:scaffold25624_cov181-Cylindrotheca_fusiformis.AAC.1
MMILYESTKKNSIYYCEGDKEALFVAVKKRKHMRYHNSSATHDSAPLSTDSKHLFGRNNF